MDLTLIRSLVTVADAGTITDAADRLYVSQSALSRRLQQLEGDLGAQLLVRGRHGVELTTVGREVVDVGRGMVTRFDRLRESIELQLGLGQGAVRIGGGATVTSFLLPTLIAEFQADHPDIRFYVKEAGSLEIAAAIASGELDLGVVTQPVPTRHVDVIPLFVDDIVLVARGDHPFAGRPVDPGDLEDQPFVGFEPGSAIRQIIEDALLAVGVQIDVVMELRSIPSILQMVAATGSLAFVSAVSLPTQPGLQAVTVRRLAISRSLGLATRHGFPLPAPARAFADRLSARPRL
jgi:DNA-binding transcriptional LysR family regulator